MTPTPDEIKTHFANAKEIRCLNFKVVVNINHVEHFAFDEVNNAYYAGNRLICVWNSTDGYAEITKLKCNTPNCEKCNCKDKVTT